MVHSKEDLALIARNELAQYISRKRPRDYNLNWSGLRMMPTFSSPADLEICKIQQKQMFRRCLNTHKKS